MWRTTCPTGSAICSARCTSPSHGTTRLPFPRCIRSTGVRWRNRISSVPIMRFAGKTLRSAFGISCSPGRLPILGEAMFSWSRLQTEFGPRDEPSRTTDVDNYNLEVNFTNFGQRAEVGWGFFVRNVELTAEPWRNLPEYCGKFHPLDQCRRLGGTGIRLWKRLPAAGSAPSGNSSAIQASSWSRVSGESSNGACTSGAWPVVCTGKTSSG